MNNNKYYIYTNSNILIKFINLFINKSIIKKKKNICPFCNEIFDNEYLYKLKNFKLKIREMDLHILKIHNMILDDLYDKICSSKIMDLKIEWCIISINNLNIMNGVYEIGSNQIYTDNKKKKNNSKIYRFSEHAGFLYFEKNTVSNINILTKYRVDSNDPLLYLPKNCIEALNVNYIYHTHPKTPYIGSRLNNGIIYEFPSISDIIHFIDHHNNGKLFGSIVIAPEGIYIIRKNNFDKKNINVDYEIMIDDLEEIYKECYKESYLKYSHINYKKLKVNGEIKLPDEIFYEQISKNYEYINKINNVLVRYDLFIDYYARIHFYISNTNTDKWIFDNIYVPFIN